VEAFIFKSRDLLLMDNDKAQSHVIHREQTAIFEQVFKEHFRNLYIYACSIIKDEEQAEEVVQHVFYKLWEKKEQIQVQQSLKSYLYRAVHNECINALRHEKVKANYGTHVIKTSSESGSVADNAAYKELQQRIDMVLNELPEQCRTIFQLSRYEELNYKEIAEKMDVSLSTVKNQVSKALHLLRARLKDYIPAIAFLIINIKNMVQ
jgi:RNA polymerase sigma-70 factor, ECF subfamily